VYLNFFNLDRIKKKNLNSIKNEVNENSSLCQIPEQIYKRISVKDDNENEEIKKLKRLLFKQDQNITKMKNENIALKEKVI